MLVPTIHTIAGVGLPGYAGDGGQATKAPLTNPLSSVVDAAGNVYVADYGNARVREINAVTGVITTIAGTGVGGLSGANGPATSAMLSGPGGLAFDVSGNLFIGDSYNNRVRVVNAATGIITTYAGSAGVARFSGDGGVATSAGFNYTDGISLDRAGNLYIADRSNYRIRRVDAVTKIVTTVVGTGVPGFSGDGGLATNAQIGSIWSGTTDLHGNLYFSDPDNARIRRVDAVTGIVKTIAGTGFGGFSGDGGPAASAQVLLGAGGSLDVDSAGNVFFTDNNNCRIREIVAATGIIQTIAGSTFCGYSGDGGPATSAQLLAPQRVHYDSKTGNFIIGDTGNNVVRGFSAGLTTFPTTTVGSVSTSQTVYLQTTAAITISSIIVPTSLDGKQEFTVNSITGCTANGTTSTPSGTTCSINITFTPGFSGQRTVPLTVVTSTGMASFPLTGFATGSQVALSPGPISTIAGTGVAGFTGDTGAATAARINSPQKTFVDAQGNIYIADSAANVVRKINATTGVITTVAGNGTACATTTATCGDGGAAKSANLNGPSGVSVDPSGNLYIADRGDNRIRVVNASTGIITTFAGTGAQSYTGDTNLANTATLNSPAAVATDQYGNVYIADTGNNAIREIDASTGVISTLVGNGTACTATTAACGDGGLFSAATLNAPLGLTVDSTRGVYIADTGDNRVRYASALNGLISTVAGTGTAAYSGDGNAALSATLKAPGDVTIDAAGDLYIADTGNNAIRLVTKSDGKIRSIAGIGTACTPTTAACGDGGLSTAAALNAAAGIALDADDDLYIADTGDSRIRKVNAKTAAFTFASTALGATSTDSPQSVNVIDTGNAALVVPATASNNPAISNNFSVGNTSTCPQLTASSSAGQLASGASCNYLLSFSPTAVGTISGSLVLTDNALGTTSPNYAMQVVSLSGTATMVTEAGTLSSSNQSPVFGQSVTLTNTFTAVAGFLPTGTVTFYSGTTSLGTGTINASGVATLATTQLPVGSDAVTAVYAGDGNFTSATSNTVTETVSRSPITGTLTASTTAPNAGQPFTLTETFVPSNGIVPTGTVTFYNGSTVLGTGTINSAGIATLTTGALPAGVDSVTAVYAGDPNYDGSASNPLTITVAKNSGSSTLTTSNAAPSFGQSIVLTDTLAPVNGIIPTGTVSFYSAGSVIGTGSVNASGVATLTTGQLPIGTDAVSAVYSGDGNNNTSTSNSVTETVSKGNDTGALTTSNAAPNFGRAVILTDTLSTLNGVMPTGTVTFYSGTTALGTGTVNGSGVATLSTANLPVGSDSVTAVYSGDTTYNTNTSAALTETVAKGTTTNTASSSTTSSTFGQTVTLTDTLTPVNNVYPTGVVTFYSGTTVLGTGTVNSTGVATLATGSLPVGADAVTAAYGGDSNFNSVTSSAITVTVAKVTGTSTLTASNTAPNFGQAVTLTDTLSAVGGVAPTGTVTFYSGSTVLGTGTVGSNGVATLTTGTLPIGTDSVTAVYGGDSNYNSVTSSPVTVTVSKGADTGALTSSNTAPSYGQAVNLTDTLSSINGVVPTGTVTFYNGTTALGTGTVNSSGVATLSTTALPVGTDSVTAVYAGDTNYVTSTSNAITETVGKSAGAGTLTSTTATPGAGQSVTFTETVPVLNGTAPTGTVTFTSGTTVLGTGTLNSSGVATLTTTALPSGTDTVTATYPGDSNYGTGTSNAITETVSKDPSSGTLTATPTNATYGQPATLTDTLARVNGLIPTGTVTFYSDSTQIGTGTVSSTGVATLSTMGLGSADIGSHNYTAVYGGDANYNGSTQGPNAITVSQASVTSSLVTSNAAPNTGQYVRFTDTLTYGNGSVPTGTVTFYSGSTVLGTATVGNSGIATFATNALANGTDSVTAVYAGDTNYTTSTSNAVTETVTRYTGTDSLTTSNPTPTFGRAITLTDTIPTLGATAPTGTVTFYYGATVLGTGTLNGAGVATLSNGTLPVGTDSVTAIYSGDANYTQVTSNAVAEMVSQANGTGTLTSSAATTTVGTPVTLTDTLSLVNSTSPTGTVTFYSGSTALGTVPVNAAGVATLTTGALPVGPDGITAVYSGDTNYATNTSNNVTVVVAKSSGANTLAASNTAPVYGQPITLTDSIPIVSGTTPSGTVTFLNGNVVLGTATINSSGVATLVTSALPVGSDPLTATYAGDANYAASTSNTASVTVTKGTSTGSLVASSTTPAAGQAVTFTNSLPTVNGVVPTGTVAFYSGTTPLGTATVNASGVATLSTTALPVGSDAITAVYSGDTTYNTSTSGPVTVTVGKAASSSTLTTSNAAPTAGTPVTFTDSVPVVGTTAPTGTVTFSSGGTVLGTANINASGIATFTTSALPVATDVVTAMYGGDANYTATTSNGVTETVSKNTGDGTLNASPTAPNAGQAVTTTYTVPLTNGVPATGTVTFYSNGNVIGTGTVNSAGVATLTTTSLLPGMDTLTATYSGDANYSNGSATATTVTVGKASAAGVLTTSNAAPTFGDSVTLIDTVPVLNGTAPTGSVTFTSGGVVLGTGIISSAGVATLRTTALPVGTDAVLANYAGDANYAGGNSNSVVETVSRDAGVDTLTATAGTTAYGQPVTFTDTLPTVNGVVPTGSVTFTAGTTVLGTATVNSSGVATFTTSSLPVGMSVVSASYTGDNNYSPSTSSGTSQTVTKATVTGALSSSNPSPAAGQTVTLTDLLPSVNGKFPTGTVTFYNGSTLLGTATVNSSGVATLSTTSLGAGTDVITTNYSGDDSFNSSASNQVTETVGKSTETGTLVTSDPAPQFGQTVTFTDTLPIVNSVVPSGSVTFYSGTTALGSGTVNSSGIATLTTSALPVGSASITAVYSGDTNYASAGSNAVAETVSKSGGTAKLSASNAAPSSGQPVTFTDMLTAVNGTFPTGVVTFYEGTTVLGTGTVNAQGIATLTVSNLPAGAGSVTAVYGGDADFSPNTSSAVAISVAKEQGQSVIASNNTAPLAAQTVTFTDTLTSANGVVPTGTVTFLEGTTVLGTATVNSAGVATFTTAGLAVGTSTVTASYGGDLNYNVSTSSNAVTEVVSKNTATITLASSMTTSDYGQPVTLSSTIVATGGPTPTGTVTFSIGTVTLGTATVNAAGVATLTTTALPVGTNAVTAAYAGDNNFYTARSNSLSQVVIASLPSVTLSSTPNPQMYGQAILFTATLQPSVAGALTGTVSFYDGTLLLGTSSVNTSNVATFSTSSLSSGLHNIHAVYTDPGTQGTVTSNVLAQSVVDFTIGSQTPNLTVNPGSAANFDIDLKPLTGMSYAFPVTLTVTGLPANFTATFNPVTLTPGTQGISSSMVIQTYTNLIARAEHKQAEQKQREIMLGSMACAFLLLPLLGLKDLRRRMPKALLMILFAVFSLGAGAALTGCGGGYFGPAPGSYTLTVTGTSGSLQHSTTVTLNVR